MAGALGCGLVFSSALTTGALWRTTVPLDSGEVRSGSVMLLSGDATGQVKDFAFGALTGSGLRPGSGVQAPLVVRNGGTSPLRYRLAKTSTNGSAALPRQLSLRLDLATGTCAAGVDVAGPVGITATPYAGALPGASTVARPLAAGATETLCVRVRLASDAPQSVAGTTTTITLTFGAQTP